MKLMWSILAFVERHSSPYVLKTGAVPRGRPINVSANRASTNNFGRQRRSPVEVPHRPSAECLITRAHWRRPSRFWTSGLVFGRDTGFLNPRLGQHSVNPCLVSRDRNVVSGREPAVQRAERPDLLRFTGSVNCRCRETGRVLTIASRRSLMTELLRRETGVLGDPGTPWSMHIWGKAVTDLRRKIQKVRRLIFGSPVSIGDYYDPTTDQFQGSA